MQESNKWWQKINYAEWLQAYENYNSNFLHGGLDPQGPDRPPYRDRIRLSWGHTNCHFNGYQLDKLEDFFKKVSSDFVTIKFKYTSKKKIITKMITKKYNGNKIESSWEIHYKYNPLLLNIHTEYRSGSEGQTRESYIYNWKYVLDPSNDYYFLYLDEKRERSGWSTWATDAPSLPKNKSNLQQQSKDNAFRCDGFKGFMMFLEELFKSPE